MGSGREILMQISEANNEQSIFGLFCRKAFSIFRLVVERSKEKTVNNETMRFAIYENSNIHIKGEARQARQARQLRATLRSARLARLPRSNASRSQTGQISQTRKKNKWNSSIQCAENKLELCPFRLFYERKRKRIAKN